MDSWQFVQRKFELIALRREVKNWKNLSFRTFFGQETTELTLEKKTCIADEFDRRINKNLRDVAQVIIHTQSKIPRRLAGKLINLMLRRLITCNTNRSRQTGLKFHPYTNTTASNFQFPMLH